MVLAGFRELPTRLFNCDKALGSKGLAIAAVNFGDSKDEIVEFARHQKASFPLAVGRHDGKDNPIFQTYHINSFPTSFLIDATGKIVRRGVKYGSELKNELSAALYKLGFDPIGR